MKRMKLFKPFMVLILFFVLGVAPALAYTYASIGSGQPAMQTKQTMQSQQMMHSGSSYQGKVYTPFSGEVPSSQSSPARVGGPRRAGWYDENGDYHTDEGEFYTGGEDKPSSQSPIGEPWVMIFFAMGFAGIIFIRKHKLNQTTDMKNTSKYITTLALLFTLGVGYMRAYTFDYPYLYFNNSAGWTDVRMLMYYHSSEEATQDFDLNQISDTKLWYCRATENRGTTLSGLVYGFGNITGDMWGWKCASGWDCETWDHRWEYLCDNFTHTGTSQTDLGPNTYYITSSGSSNLSVTKKADGDDCSKIPQVNATQAAKKRDTGTTYSDVSGSWPATLKLQGTYLSAAGTSSRSVIESTTSSDGAGNKTYGAVITGLISHSLKDGTLASNYYLEGWGTGSTPSVTTAIYDYNISSATTVYAFFSKTYALTYAEKGTYGSSSLSVSVSDFSGTKTSGSSIPCGHTITFTASPATGYEIVGWYSDADCETPIDNGTNTTYTISSLDAATSVYCKFRPAVYNLTIDKNGATEDGAVTLTYLSSTATNFTGITRTGYVLNGYYTAASGGVKILNADGTLVSYSSGVNDDYLNSSGQWINTSSPTLYAQWTAGTYTITLDGDEPNKGNAGTRAVSGSATYDASMPAQTGTLPTAANGYHFMGFYSLQNGDGVQVIDESGNWVASADGYTDASTHWVHADDATLYAYFKKAEVTEIAFTSALVEANTTAEAEITVSPSPVGSTNLCFKLLYNSGAELADQPSFTYNGSTHKVTFIAPTSPGSYKLQVILRLGSDECSGTVLDAEDESFTVAGPNVVTIKYMYGDTKTEVKASTTVEGDPLNWTEVSVGTASDDPIGYTFSTWELGDGMTLKDGDALTDRTIQFKSTYNATLKAKYTKKNLIYFYNTLGWENVYVYFYSSDKYWDDTYGTGAKSSEEFTKDEDTHHKPHYRHFWGEMTQIGTSNVYYFDYQAAAAIIDPSNASEINGYTNVAFTKDAQGRVGETEGHEWFYSTEVVRRGDFSTALPMYVPYNGGSQTKNGGTATYFFQGYWMNYPENTGYELYIYNDKQDPSSHGGSYYRRIPFEMSEGRTTPLVIKTDLEGGHTYGFKFVQHGSSDSWYGNTGTMTNGHSGDVGQGDWQFEPSPTVYSDCGLTTSSAGNYEFTLTYGEKSSNYYFMVGVKFPEATGDYRVLYKDDNTSGEWFVSHVIPRLLNKDTVSFFVRPNAHPKMKMQKCSATYVNNVTNVTWTDTITEATNMLSSMPAAISAGGDGVYYFCMNKGEDGKRVMGDVAAYEGEYYIRTDCAPSQWDNYRNSDHRMTYSEYAEEHNSDPAYTHYYMKYATTGTNVKFVVANDYSPYISDTLKGGDHVNMSSHTLNANANIRFMWDRRNNNVGREFIAPAQNDGSKFLVMQGEVDKIADPQGNRLLDASGNNKGGGTDAIQFTDKQDWIYTADVKAVPGGRIKLYKSYDSGTHYIYGDDDASFADTHAIELIGGTGDASAQTIRVIYDFKTNRLMTAWIPADTIKTALTLNADIMIVREHQDAASNIVLNGSGKIDLETGKMIYGVMRFNRYVLNNREKTGAHGYLPIANWKSQYERSMYYISFPFDVKINEIFGMGEYGKHWIMQRYRGDQRAQKGFWIDSGTFWKFMGPDMTLNANEGYILTLDLNKFDYNETGEGEMWHNNVEDVELYFPAAEAVNITQVDNFELPALDSTIYKCTINRGAGTDGDRRVKDSYWRCIGVPSFADYSGVVLDSVGEEITWKPDGLPFLYDINWADKSITAYSGKNFPFKAMHAYLVQNGSEIHWSNVYTYAPPTPVAKPRRTRDESSELEFRLELNQLDSMIDQTYVRLSDEENVTSEFDFGQDMSKEFNSGANIYTLIGYEQVAANSMPFSNQTTIVPVGLRIASAGEYTFAMPDGTSGVGITLVDNVSGERTNLSLTDYTVTLNAGTYDSRFSLEISAVSQSGTGMDQTGANSKDGVRKVMVDGVLYIVHDGQIFDARGQRVE